MLITRVPPTGHGRDLPGLGLVSSGGHAWPWSLGQGHFVLSSFHVLVSPSGRHRPCLQRMCVRLWPEGHGFFRRKERCQDRRKASLSGGGPWPRTHLSSGCEVTPPPGSFTPSAPCRGAKEAVRLLGLHGCHGDLRPSDEFFRLKHPINRSELVCREKEKRK